MPKKTYKNKGVPVKGSEMRLNRTVRLSDSAWAGLDEVAKILNVSRADLVEWWALVLTNSPEQLKVIASNEQCSVEDVGNRLFEMLPDGLRQLRANEPPPGLPLQVKPTKNESQQQQSVSIRDGE